MKHEYNTNHKPARCPLGILVNNIVWKSLILRYRPKVRKFTEKCSYSIHICVVSPSIVGVRCPITVREENGIVIGNKCKENQNNRTNYPPKLSNTLWQCQHTSSRNRCNCMSCGSPHSS